MGFFSFMNWYWESLFFVKEVPTRNLQQRQSPLHPRRDIPGRITKVKMSWQHHYGIKLAKLLFVLPITTMPRKSNYLLLLHKLIAVTSTIKAFVSRICEYACVYHWGVRIPHATWLQAKLGNSTDVGNAMRQCENTDKSTAHDNVTCNTLYHTTFVSADHIILSKLTYTFPPLTWQQLVHHKAPSQLIQLGIKSYPQYVCMLTGDRGV